MLWFNGWIRVRRRLCSVPWLFCLAGIPALGAQPQSTPFDRAAFDRLDTRTNPADRSKAATGDQLAWGESYVMLAYLEMYRATGDRAYLDKLVDCADRGLAQRDDKRGFGDYSGRSRPAWSVGGRYTVAEFAATDAQGRDVLRFRSTKYAFNDETTIQVAPRPGGRLFDLVIANEHWKVREEHAGLCLDPDAPDFVERRVNACDWVAADRHVACGHQGSELVTVEGVGHHQGLPTHDRRGRPLNGRAIPMEPLVMAYHGYSGQITYPMLEFAWLVRQDAALEKEYGSRADAYVRESAEVYRDADEEWQDGPRDGEGYYVFGRRGCPFWSDGVEKPFNYLCSEARSLLRLAQLTRDPHWEGRARAIARLVKRHLRVSGDGAYVWNYWWGAIEKGWTRENSPSFNTPTWKGQTTVEDISHGHLEVDFARLCTQAGWVFDRTDMLRFARTFLKNVVDRENGTTRNRVDGSGGSGDHDTVIGGWLELAAWEPEVARAALEIGQRRRLFDHPSGAALWTVARLIKWNGQIGLQRPARSRPASGPAGGTCHGADGETGR